MTILKEAENLASSSLDERIRVLRLSEQYTRYNVNELVVRLNDTGVTFSRLDDNEPGYDEDGMPVRPASKNYSLSASEADAFVDAWLRYKTDMTEALKQEEQRKAGVLAEAHKLAGELGLEIEANEDDTNYDGSQRYRLKHSTRYISHNYAYGPDQLLSHVKEFQNNLEQEKKTIAEAKRVAERITELCGDVCKLTSRKPAYNGYYDMHIDGRFSHWSADQLHASAILDRFKHILADLEQEQAQNQESAVS